MKNKIVVEIRDGMVQAVYADKSFGINIIICDWDDIRDGGKAIYYPMQKYSTMPKDTSEQVEQFIHM